MSEQFGAAFSSRHPRAGGDPSFRERTEKYSKFRLSWVPACAGMTDDRVAPSIRPTADCEAVIARKILILLRHACC